MPTPKKNESRGAYLKRCIPIRRKEHPEESRERSIRVCFELYRKEKNEITAAWNKSISQEKA